MTATTPPKGKPTPGKRDRKSAVRIGQRRARIRRLLWVLLAVVVVAAVVYFGSGTGGNHGPVIPGGVGTVSLR